MLYVNYISERKAEEKEKKIKERRRRERKHIKRRRRKDIGLQNEPLRPLIKRERRQLSFSSKRGGASLAGPGTQSLF